jgi:hypothetical protein
MSNKPETNAMDFFFGSPCELCQHGNRSHRWTRYDGTGSWRMHKVWVGPGHDWLFDYGSEYCARNGWFSRHWIMTTTIFGFPTIVSLMALLDFISRSRP